MAKTQSPSYPHGSSASRGKLIVVMIVAALVVVLSAFVWPGWALNKTDEVTKVQQQTATEPTKPSIKATALPDDASELLKAMPDSVLNYARTKAGASETWKSASPLEEYTLTYSTGKSAKDVTVIVAQWSDSDTVKKQYDELAKNLTGKELKSGDVKVSGKSTGSYTVRADSKGGKTATALWQNDTVVFEVTGSKESVLSRSRCDFVIIRGDLRIHGGNGTRGCVSPSIRVLLGKLQSLTY